MGYIHWLNIALVVVIGFIVFIIFQARREVKKHLVWLESDEFSDGMRKGQLIDVRKKIEFEAGYINGSRNMPLSMLSKTLGKLRTDQPIYLVCKDGKGAKRATVLLASKGFKKIHALKGGISNWMKPLKSK